jgi:hypothetical protein
MGSTASVQKSTAKPASNESKKAHAHDHEHEAGPHGGHIIEFAGLHAEFCKEESKKKITLYILDEALKEAVPVETESLSISFKKPAIQVEFKAEPTEKDPKGKSSRFSAIHDEFAKDRTYQGMLFGKFGGQVHQMAFNEECNHDH